VTLGVTVKKRIVATHHITLRPFVSSGTGMSHHIRSLCVTLEKIMQIDLNMSPFQYFRVLATNVTPLNPFLET